ncbi:hypothetical protein ABBQ38_011155 [Trebouxia sp. C0009 RCD-2024]
MIASFVLSQRPLATSFPSCRSAASAKRQGWQPTGFYTERHVTHCYGTSQSAEQFYEFLLDQQASIIQQTEGLEESGVPFLRDQWSASPSRCGITAVLQDGQLLEKGAVNVSLVQGTLTPERATTMSGRGRGIDPKGGQPYSAAALSLVYHPANPFAPTLRADVRLFQVEGQSWYGGGCDLTPAYLFEEDACCFHRHWKATCDKHDAKLYPRYKAWCDDYFYIPARQEHRGIGGIFFDDLEAADAQFDVAQVCPVLVGNGYDMSLQ